MSKLGFIGLGIMGTPMAVHLIKAGRQVFLNTRSQLPADLTAAGGVACASAQEVAQQADIIFLMLPDTPDTPDTPDVATVLFGDNGVAVALKDVRRGPQGHGAKPWST